MNALISNFKLESLIQSDLRSTIANLIEAHAQAMEDLIALMDALDGDPDLEPSLGAPEAKVSLPWGCGFALAMEGDQSMWADGDNSVGLEDSEETNEDGGNILDGLEASEPTPGGSELDLLRAMSGGLQ